ncbi:flagellar hook-associated protein FlgK [Sulfitobacter sp. F26169L]|uniref:flagellar hook-associated protein FlgK n=1 Tax=Sulfitobacter sp. F26169L TaxID=2996015 RepID=UPI002260DA88|nr:flagellar hook-associated protein FlgK [Sulfitobacter sp. F26169L]MCX7565762.1 flagellar hook-associated protein FlgK [Sulfitobacter sp. F26169L]
MSLTGAMNAAISGLRAAARGSEIVSNNISNALTPSYGRREVALSALGHGASGGVRIDGINRHMNDGVLADRRLAEAAQQHTQTAVDFFHQLEDISGLAGNPDGLSGRLAAFEESLITAASRPDSIERLQNTVAQAQQLIRGIGIAAQNVQEMRTRADTNIAREVATLNTALEQVEQLNIQIVSSHARGGSSPALLDQRQKVLDTIGSIVPTNVVPRDDGAIAIYTEGGAILLDITAAKIGFDQQNIVTEFQTLDAGTLSGLTLNGQGIRTSALAGGSLGGHFAVRDEHGVEAQTNLDALARDLVERFSDPALDPSRGAGDPALFTDSGNAFAPHDEVGLSRRLMLNAAVDPKAGGDAWRLRDGLGAISPGDVGDATLLNNLRSALDTLRPTASGHFGSGPQSIAKLFSSFTGILASSRGSAEQDLSYSSARLAELTQQQLSDGVDTDQELQNLLLLERAYAANARVIQAADAMLETLTRL